jgi:aspartate aminotransferase
MCADRNNSRLNPLVRELALSATLAIHEHSERLIAQGHTVFRMGFGQSPFPVPEIVVAALRWHAHEKAYMPVQGLPELREAVAVWFRRTEGLDVGAESVMVGPGSKELMFLLQLVFDAEVLIPAPSWVSYAPQAGLFNREVVWLPTDIAGNWCITPGQLADVCRADPERARLLILNYPGNPTGVSYAPEKLEALAAVAREFGVIILADEIYSGLHFSGAHTSIARYYPEGTIVSNGLSKWCGAGGWRLGAFIFPENLGWLRDAMAAVASETYSSVAAPVQYAAITAFEGGVEIEAYLDTCRRLLQAISVAAAYKLRAAGATVCDADGGFYLFPRFTATARAQSSAELCERVLEDTGVAMLPASDFGHPPEDLTTRIALVDFDGSAVLDALKSGAELNDDFLGRHCPKVLDGLDRLADWLGGP